MADSVGYIYRARDTQQQIFDIHAVLDPDTNIPKDWLENDEKSIKYIQNRTHYILQERFELLKPTWYMENEQGGYEEHDENQPILINLVGPLGQLANYKTYKLSKIFRTAKEQQAYDSEGMAGVIPLLLKECYLQKNSTVIKLINIYNSLKEDAINNNRSVETQSNLPIASEHQNEIYYVIDTDKFYKSSGSSVWTWGEYKPISFSSDSIDEISDSNKKAFFISYTLPTDSSTRLYLLLVQDAGTYSMELDDAFEQSSLIVTQEYEQGIYGFCKYNYELDKKNYIYPFIINSRERVVQLPHKYYQDIWDAVEQAAGTTDARIGAVETRVATLEGKVSTLETTTIPNINDAIADINSDISNLDSTKMNKVNPQGSGTMIFNGAAIFASGVYEGATATTNGKLITKADLDSAIAMERASINSDIALKLNIANPAATGNFTLASNNVTAITMYGATGNIVSEGTVKADDFIFTTYNQTSDVSLESILDTKRDENDFLFNNGDTIAHFSGDLYVNNTKQVATIDQLDYSKFLGIYYQSNSSIPTYPTAQHTGDYIFLIKDYVGNINNKLIRAVYNGSSWIEQNETYDRIFTNQQWININTSYAQDIADLNSSINALTNLVNNLQIELHNYEVLIDEIIPDAEGAAFGPGTYILYENVNNTLFPRT